ncbi:MAG: potassium channel family protein [Candidatus Limisoma sp.]
MRYLVVGVGNFGKAIAETLCANKYEVVAVDSSEQRIDAIKDSVSASFIFNATDPVALASLPMGEIDCAVVAIGQSVEQSLRIIAILKQTKIKHIYARVIDDMHEMILKAMNVDRLLYPEEYAGRIFAESLISGKSTELK